MTNIEDQFNLASQKGNPIHLILLGCSFKPLRTILDEIAPFLLLLHWTARAVTFLLTSPVSKD